MKQFTALLCLMLLSLSTAESPPAPPPLPSPHPHPQPAPVISANCNTTEFQAGLVLEEINKDREDGFIFSLLRVADAHSQQAGAGTIFYFTIDVLETTCPVIGGKSWKECDVRPFHQSVFGQCKASMYLSLPWRRVKLYNYNCTLSRVPPEKVVSICPDCPIIAKDVTPFVEKAERMALEFNMKGSQAHYFKLLKVERASTAWMHGPSTYIEFSIKETNCPSSTANPADCQFLEKGKAHVGFCKGSMTNPPDMTGEHVDVACYIYDPKPTDCKHDTTKKVCGHGETQHNCQVKSGAEAPTDCKHDTKKEVCDHGETQHNCQVKSGAEAVTHTCKVNAYQKPGETTFTIESLNCDLPSAGEPEVLLPVLCPGCPQHISGNSGEVQAILQQAIAQYNKESNQANIYKVGEIIKATSQVAAGWKYVIQFKIQETNCLKSDVAHQSQGCKNGKDHEHHPMEPCVDKVDLSKCHAKTGEGVTHTCKVVYWIQTWLNKREIVSLNCDLPAGGSPAEHFEKNCRGCPTAMSTNSEKLESILHLALEKYNKESNQAHLFKLGHIIKATSQVVSGVKYTIEFTIEETNCTAADVPPKRADCKGDGGDHHHHHHEHKPHFCAKDVNWQSCHHRHDEGEETLRCKAEITTRPWEKTTGITLDCNITIVAEPLILLLPCPGCPFHISADSEELKPFLKEVVQKYNQESNKDYLYKMGPLLSAKKQVVSGFKYFIEFTIEETNCSRVDFPTIFTVCKTDEHHGHHGHDHGHSHEHGHRHGHDHGHGHRHGHDHGHHHHHHHKRPHGSGHHDSSSEEQTGVKPVAPPQSGPVGWVHYITLVHATDVIPAPSIQDPSHPVALPASTAMPHGRVHFDPFTDPEPMPFPTTHSTSPSCPGEPKHSLPLILPLLPVP